MIEKVVKAMRDMELKTCTGFHLLSKGEVKRIGFKGPRAFKVLLELGDIVEADRGEKELKIIPVILPVILPEVTEDTIVGVEPVEVDPSEGIDPDKPDLPYPKEGLPALEVSLDEVGEPEGVETPEDLRQSEPPIEAIDYRDIPEPRPTDTPDVLNEASQQEGTSEFEGKASREEIFPEQETESLSEVEEIPIEKQDESKSEPKLSDVIDKPNVVVE